VVGGGLAGLSAALSLTGFGHRVELWEQSAHFGGRCRSWYDGQLKRTIDNGNHLLLSANINALAYLDEIGARQGLREDLPATYSFFDLHSGESWRIKLGSLPFPAWTMKRSGRLPGSSPLDYLALSKLLVALPGSTVGDHIQRGHRLYKKLLEPLCYAVMNGSPDEVSAQSFARVLKASLLKGGSASRPLLAREGLGACFIDPAVAELERRGASLRLHGRLSALERENGRVSALTIADQRIDLGPEDKLVLAVPPQAAQEFLPKRRFPLVSSAILNLHFRLPIALPEDTPEIIGVIGGTAQWIFRRGDMLSVTVSAANGLMGESAERLVAKIWAEVVEVVDYPRNSPPPCRVIKEKRATFLQSPEAEEMRPAQKGPEENLYLAGDWTATGYPATIEGAILSGRLAAAEIVRKQRR
jgi:squalene-associated FAD-dependent desaturase